MKSTVHFTLIAGFFLFFAQATQAQIVWKGGAPGQEANWNNPKNWSQYRIPGPDDMVIIPNTGSTGNFYPIITEATGPIFFLEIQGGAKLTVAANGILEIDGIANYRENILLIGKLEVEGIVRIHNKDYTHQVAAATSEKSNSTWIRNIPR